MREHPHVVAAPDDTIRVEACIGRLTVPESQQTGAGAIELTYLRLPARTARPRTPWVFLAGGPGVSATDTLQRNLPAFLAASELADVIAIDQRGSGRSRPALDSLERLELGNGPLTREAFLGAFLRAARRGAERWRAAGVDLTAYNTETNADDIEALRQALGVERISLIGGSYGSHLGLAVLRRHPDSVERAVLGKVEGPDDTFKLPSTVQGVLREVAARAVTAEELDGSCPDLLGLMGEVFARLDRQPAATASGRPLSGFEARLATAHALGRTAVVASLPRVFLAARDGDHEPLERLVGTSAIVPAWMPSAMNQAVDLASGASAARRERIRQEAPHTLLGDLVDFPTPEAGEAWGIHQLPDAFREPVVSSVPVLLVSGDIDSRTPPGNAEAVLAHLENGVHVVLSGLAHDFFLLDPGLTPIRRFMAGEAIGSESLSIPFHFEEPRWRKRSR